MGFIRLHPTCPRDSTERCRLSERRHRLEDGDANLYGLYSDGLFGASHMIAVRTGIGSTSTL